jgi:hypothetical protein
MLRCRLELTGPCRNGSLACAASGPFQMYIDGLRIAGAPGGSATEAPLWYTRSLSGSWDAGEHELVVLVDGSAHNGERWFAMHGELAASAVGSGTHAVESGLHWHGLELPVAPTGTQAAERFSALEDPRSGDRFWEGVVSVQATPPVGDASNAAEKQIEAREFAAFEETAADADLTFSPVAVLPRSGKFVHRDGLLAGLAPAASIRTAAGHGFTFVLDFGRIVTGVPNFRLRDGRAGIVDVGWSTAWGRIDSRLRYVCGSERQDWFALRAVRARYAVVHLSDFDEECQFEHFSLCERSVAVTDSAMLDLGEPFQSTWVQAPLSLRDSRLDVYHTAPPPENCDWLGLTALMCNDAARTGHTDTARATLLGRAPDPTTARGSGFAACLEAYHLRSGDDKTAAALLPAALVSSRVPTDPTTPTQTLAEQAASAAAAARICGHLARTQEADDCNERLQGLYTSIESRWREDRGLYADAASGDDVSQFTQALVLLAGGVSAARALRMATTMRGAEVTPVGDLRQAFFLAEGLWRGGQGGRALEVVKNQWLRIADREGITWRDKRSAEAGRLAPGPDHLLTTWLLGVSPTEPGFRRARVRPALGVIPRASGEVLTPKGPLRVSWRVVDFDEESNTTVTLETPEACVVELVIDRGNRRQPTLSVNGEVVWRNEKIYPNPSVRAIAASEDAVTLVFDRQGTWKVILA